MIALFDMDGTLADFDGHLAKSMNALKHPDEPDYVSAHDENEPDYIQARRKLIQTYPGWWLEMPTRPGCFTLLHKLKEMGYEIEILTKGPQTKSNAWSEKLLWCQKHFGMDITVNIVGKTKARTYGRILVDDFPDYAESWLARRPRGLVIMPAQPYNVNFSHPNAIRFDKNLDEVLERVKLNKQDFLERYPVETAAEVKTNRREELDKAADALHAKYDNQGWLQNIGLGLTKEEKDYYIVVYVYKNKKEIKKMLGDSWNGFPLKIEKIGKLIPAG